MKCDFIKTQTVQDKLYHNKVLMVDVKINYPQLVSGYTENKTRFNTYYRQKSRQNYRYASNKLFQAAIKHYEVAKAQGFPFNNFEFLETFEPTYCNKPYISLYYDIYEFTGGAHGNTVRKGNTWDMKRGVMLSLDSLFVSGFDYKTFILRYIESEAKRRLITGLSTYFDDLTGNLKKHFDDKNFYLTEEGLAIFYPLYTIAPYSEGIQVFIIPYPLFGDKLKYNF